MKIFEPSSKRLNYFTEEQLFRDDEEPVGVINTLVGHVEDAKLATEGDDSGNLETVDYMKQKIFKAFFDKFRANAQKAKEQAAEEQRWRSKN